MNFDEWDRVYSSQFVRIVNPSEELVEDMARERAGREAAWNASLKEAAEVAQIEANKWVMPGSQNRLEVALAIKFAIEEKLK